MKVLILVIVALSAVGAFAQGFDEAIEQVGLEYAREYTRPLIDAFGINQNSALFTTANIPVANIQFSFGLKMMNTQLEDSDQQFDVYKSVTLDESYGVNEGDDGYGESGVIWMHGPTVFGSETDTGELVAIYGGVPVASEQTISGVIETKNIPMMIPEFTIGGVSGLRGVLRWLPEIDGGDIGKIGYSGFGVQYGVNNLFTTVLPVDVMVGFFKQSLTIGDSANAEATSYHVAVSREFGPLTGYAGYAYESSSVDISYTLVDDETKSENQIDFAADGVQTSRTTFGATLNFGLKLNAEASFGERTNLSGGILFGF
ncbi:hypothetical protein HN388_03420 [bacterium]|jgi:hypothetical protein|nr:hypothetical protein [bacterium]MBT4292391.1 hypothetical protein [bacterium]MBT7310895.1 hypothetical protein [bacterium]